MIFFQSQTNISDTSLHSEKVYSNPSVSYGLRTEFRFRNRVTNHCGRREQNNILEPPSGTQKFIRSLLVHEYAQAPSGPDCMLFFPASSSLIRRYVRNVLVAKVLSAVSLTLEKAVTSQTIIRVGIPPNTTGAGSSLIVAVTLQALPGQTSGNRFRMSTSVTSRTVIS